MTTNLRQIVSADDNVSAHVINRWNILCVQINNVLLFRQVSVCSQTKIFVCILLHPCSLGSE